MVNRAVAVRRPNSSPSATPRTSPTTLARLPAHHDERLVPAALPDPSRAATSGGTRVRDHPTGQPHRHFGRRRADWPLLRQWFDAEPERTGRELFERLQAEHPGVYPDGQLRHSSVASKGGGEKLRGDWSSQPQRWSLALGPEQKCPMPQPNDPIPACAEPPPENRSYRFTMTRTHVQNSQRRRSHDRCRAANVTHLPRPRRWAATLSGAGRSVHLQDGCLLGLIIPAFPKALWICRCAWTTRSRRPQPHRAHTRK